MSATRFETDMTHTVNYVAADDYVLIAFVGEVTTEDLQKCRAEASDLLTANDCTRLLVDATREAPRRDVLGDYDFTSQHRAQLPPGTRHAVLIRASESEYVRFVENVARNRGVDLELFVSLDEALSWLNSV